MSQELSIYEPRNDIQVYRAPSEVIAEATEVATTLRSIIAAKPKKVMMNGEQYLEFEDWQTVGKFYGVTAKIITTEFIAYGSVEGFLARAVAIRPDGMEISSAEAMCMNDEDKWSTRPKYGWVKDEKGRDVKKQVGSEQVPMFQLRSMAQTRACAKALRNVLAWVVVLAGYKATPAEELTGSEGGAVGEQAHAVSPVSDGGHVTITRVEVKTGKSKAGKPWTKYEITDSTGQVYSTFSESMSEAAQKAVDAGCPVSIKSTPWESNGKQGKNLDMLDFLPVEAKETTTVNVTVGGRIEPFKGYFGHPPSQAPVEAKETTTQVRQPASPELQKKILDAVDKVVQFPPWMGAEEALHQFSEEDKDGKKLAAKDFSHLFSSEKWAKSTLVKMQAFLIKAEAEAGGAGNG